MNSRGIGRRNILDKKLLRKLKEEGLNNTQIAARMGVCLDTIKRAFRRMKPKWPS